MQGPCVFDLSSKSTLPPALITLVSSMSFISFFFLEFVNILYLITKVLKVIVIVRLKKTEMCTNSICTKRVEFVSMKTPMFEDKNEKFFVKIFTTMENFEDCEKLHKGIKNKG